MRRLSMAFQTDLIFWRAEGRVERRDGYWRVETPSNPTFYGGNLLFFDQPPMAGDERRWPETFAREFRHLPEVRHVLLMWDVEGEGDDGKTVAPFLAGGFELRTNVTLLAERVVPPPKLNSEIQIKRIERDEEWDAVLDAQVRRRDARYEPEPYAIYKRKWLDVRRRLAAEGRGAWYGAFLGGRLVADLGLFREGALARFQDVATEPEFQRRGICGTLVYEVSRAAFREGVERLVMVADATYHAAAIYESVGFEPRERYSMLFRHPQ